jgi:hypothetical protein
MLLVALALALLPIHGIGAPYPAATIQGTVEQQPCRTRYDMSSTDPISKLATFYLAQAAAAGVPLLDDSGAKFADYRTFVFVKQPRFLDVVLARHNGRTTARIGYHLTVPPGCK